MATQFYAAATGEWVGTRWCGPGGRLSFDYGVLRERRAEVEHAAMEGAEFFDEANRTYTGDEFLSIVWRCRTTFGEYGGTFEVGSGDLAKFNGL